MRRLKIIAFTICLFSFISGSMAQEVRKVSLDDVIALAQKQAPLVQLAKTKLSNNYWIYQSTLANYKPQIVLQGEIPDLQRSSFQTTLPSGEQQFIRQASLGSSLGLQLQQDLALTGGSVFAGTGLSYLRNFKLNGVDASNQYFSDIVYVGFSQPLFAFNQLKFEKKLAPLQYSEATRAYAEEMESIAMESAALFFEIFSAQLNLEAAQKNKSSADSLFEISKGRFSVGRIAETDLLQIELSSMNANASLASALLNKQTSSEALRNFLGIKDVVDFDLVAPTKLPDYQLEKDRAVLLSQRNRSKSFEFQRRILQADARMATAKAETGIQANVFARFGLSRNGAANVGEAYKDPSDDEQINVGIQIPIADWGKSKARLEIAESNRNLEQLNIEQERINIEQEVRLKVQQFDLVRNQVALALRAYEVAQKREDITRKRYLIGKVDVTELNLALRAMDEGRISYISALQSFWLAHYEMRGLTLYDFVNERSLVKSE